MEFNQCKFPFEIFGQRSAILDPIPAVDVEQVSQVPNLRPMNVAANHAGHPNLSPILDHGLLVILDVFHRCLRFQLDE